MIVKIFVYSFNLNYLYILHIFIEKMQSGDTNDIWADHEIQDMGWQEDDDEGKITPELVRY